MNDNEILAYLKTEFAPVTLATEDATILQMISNAKRYWSTHSAFAVVRMFPTSGAITLQAGATTSGRIQLTPDFKQVVKVYPSTTPDWILGNYPLWSLLGITIIDNLTSDLIMLSEAFRNYRYYMGTDFHFTFQKSNNPGVGGYLYTTNLPTGTTGICVVGTKRIVNGPVALNIDTSATAGILELTPITAGTLILSNGTQTYTDDGNGVLVSSESGYAGTIDYDTGEWTVDAWLNNNAQCTGTANYTCVEEIKSDFILEWLLAYSKCLVKMCEGNALRKMSAVAVQNDGQQLYDEGKEEKKELEEKLNIESRWLCFAKKF
jgi:hypothetical protein